MPVLTCTVENCYYNKRNNCCKGEIEVGGRNAHDTEETCCESFQEKGRDGYTNVYSEGHPCKTIDVMCEAASCSFNDHQVCQAQDIGIAGAHACHSTQETECASYRERG